MADAKVSSLNEVTTPQPGDLFYIVDDPSGSPEGKKITHSNAVYGGAAAGGLYTKDGAGSQTLTTQNTWYKVTQLDSANSGSQNVTSDADNNKLTVTRAGGYLCMWQISFTGSSVSTYEVAVYNGGVINNGSVAARALGASSDVGSFSATAGIVVSAVPLDIELYVRCTTGVNKTFSIKHAQLNIIRVT